MTEKPQIDYWRMIVTMPDGSEWAYPVGVIAHNRAKHYAEEFGGDVERSLKEDTIPLFEADAFEIMDWAANNMNEDDVVSVCVKAAPAIDRQMGWICGNKRVEGSPS